MVTVLTRLVCLLVGSALVACSANPLSSKDPSETAGGAGSSAGGMLNGAAGAASTPAQNGGDGNSAENGGQPNIAGGAGGIGGIGGVVGETGGMGQGGASGEYTEDVGVAGDGDFVISPPRQRR